MRNWMSGIRGLVLMVALWVVGWGLGFGGLIEAFVDPEGEILDVWLTAMAIPGFIGGVVFSIALRLAGGGRSFDEVPWLHYAACGAAAGAVIGAIAFARGIELTLTAGKIFLITTALGVIAALGSAIFFRFVAKRQSNTMTD